METAITNIIKRLDELERIVLEDMKKMNKTKRIPLSIRFWSFIDNYGRFWGLGVKNITRQRRNK